MAVSDLTGYTWVGGTTLNISASATYSITGTGYFLEHQGSFDGTFSSMQLVQAVQYETLAMFSLNNSLVWSGTWSGQEPFTMEFTGGTDVTNATLIAWLEANGTLTAPVEPTQSDYLEIYSNDERATHYKIYANGILVATIARVNVIQEGSELTVLSAPATQNGSEVTLG